jgi:predicted TIM-barrel fold metal-dependent hydrolase
VRKNIGRRAFLGKATLAALTVTAALDGGAIDRVLFAADYPYAGMKEAVEDVERTPLSDSDKEKIYHLNAEKLLRL